MKKLIPLLSIFLGESLAIYSEVAGAKNITDFKMTYIKMSLVMFIAALLLIYGYMAGIRNSINIWVISAISIVSIIIMEPIVTYIIFQELPSRGALVGLLFGIAGLLSTLFL